MTTIGTLNGEPPAVAWATADLPSRLPHSKNRRRSGRDTSRSGPSVPDGVAAASRTNLLLFQGRLDGS